MKLPSLDKAIVYVDRAMVPLITMSVVCTLGWFSGLDPDHFSFALAMSVSLTMCVTEMSSMMLHNSRLKQDNIALHKTLQETNRELLGITELFHLYVTAVQEALNLAEQLSANGPPTTPVKKDQLH